MTRTTFATFEIVGPSMPLTACEPGNSEQFRLHDRAVTFRCVHRNGAWKPESLQRLADRSGVRLVSAYWMNYSSRHGYSGAAKHPII